MHRGSHCSEMAVYRAVMVCLLSALCLGMPTKVHRSDAAGSESLSNILRDLENAVFRLKEYSLRLDYESRKSSAESDTDFESYPELVAELRDRKTPDESSNKTSSSQQQQHVVDLISSTGGGSGAPAATSTGNTDKSSNDLPPSSDDISLREALEFLVNLAKQKKQEKRDHDIPFPLTQQ